VDTILVTGAAGTVGSYVVPLAEAAGYRVVANDRTATGVRVPVRGEVRAGDLRSGEVIREVVRGCDVVVHAAAEHRVDAGAADLARVNTDVVAHLYEAAEAAGARRFVHLSTSMLYDPTAGQPLTEPSALAPRGPLGLSKHGAEMFLRGKTAAGSLEWTVLRMAPVYGQRGRHFAAALLCVGPILRLLTPVLPRPTGGPSGTMVHAEDVARAIIFALSKSETAGEIYNVSDGDPMTLGDRIAETFRAYGLRTIPTGRLPKVVLEGLGRTFQAPGAHGTADVASLAAWRLVTMRHGLKPALRPRLDREAMTLLYQDLLVDSGKLRSLGWEPRHASFGDGFRQVLRWYQAEQWVPRYG